MRILVLSGTTEGRALCAALAAEGHLVEESLAGRTEAAWAASGEAQRGQLRRRVGGFGGAQGLAASLRLSSPDAVVDATHPFAETMHAHAAHACRATGVPLLRLERPGWSARPDADSWTWVDGHPAAAAAAAGGGRVLLTVGRQSLAAYRRLPDVCARVAEVPVPWVNPAGWVLRVERGPFERGAEEGLLRQERIRVLVSKDAGGDATSAKLDAAAAVGAEVIMVRRPGPPDGVPVVASVPAALAWLADGRAPFPS